MPESPRTGGAGGFVDGFVASGPPSFDRIIMRRIRAARADCVSLPITGVPSSSAGGFVLLAAAAAACAFFDRALPPPASSDCGDLSSCCFECTSTPGLSGHLPTAVVAPHTFCRRSDDDDGGCGGAGGDDDGSVRSASSPYPAGGFGHCVRVAAPLAAAPGTVVVALPSGLQPCGTQWLRGFENEPTAIFVSCPESDRSDGRCSDTAMVR